MKPGIGVANINRQATVGYDGRRDLLPSRYSNTQHLLAHPWWQTVITMQDKRHTDTPVP